MPIRQRSRTPTKSVSLRETLDWLAFDNFNGPPLIGAEIEVAIIGEASDVEALEIAAFYREQSLELAKEDLVAALQDDDIRANGQFSDRFSNNSSENDWRDQKYEHHAAERNVIPSNFWRPDGVDWEANKARSPEGEYADIVLEREEVLAIWPLEEDLDDGKSEHPGENSRDREGQKRGRKEQFSKQEFFALCAWEFAVNDIPETKAKMVGRMADLCSVIWGVDRTPGETWLKEQVKYLYDHQDKYEKGRQEIERSGISD
jgi:hypothetical protein